MLLTVGRSYVRNDVTHSTLLDRACACSYENLPKYRSYRVSNTVLLTVGSVLRRIVPKFRHFHWLLKMNKSIKLTSFRNDPTWGRSCTVSATAPRSNFVVHGSQPNDKLGCNPVLNRYVCRVGGGEKELVSDILVDEGLAMSI